jgi:predicted nucleic acid-binding protein
LELADPEGLFASVITLGEIQLGIESMPPGKKRMDLEEWVDRRLPEWFESNLLPVTKAISERWARVTVQARKKGSKLDMADGLIAATALEHQLDVVTRNVKDFEGLGVTVINPWEFWA